MYNVRLSSSLLRLSSHLIYYVVALFFLLLSLTQANAEFLPGARIAYQNLDKVPVGICDPTADQLTDPNRDNKGQKSASGTNVIQSCIGQHIALKSECNLMLPITDDEPFKRHAQDELGFDEHGNVVMRRGTYDVLLAFMEIDEGLGGEKIDNPVIVDRNGVQSGKGVISIVKDPLQGYFVHIFDRDGHDTSLDLENYDATAQLSQTQKDSLANLNKILTEWFARPDKKKSTSHNELQLIKANVFQLTGEQEQGEYMYTKEGEKIATPQGLRSCAALGLDPHIPFKVGVEFHPTMPTVQSDGSAWPTLTVEVPGQAKLPDIYLSQGGVQGLPIYATDGSKIKDLEKLDLSAGVGQNILWTDGQPVYDSVNVLSFDGTCPKLDSNGNVQIIKDCLAAKTYCSQNLSNYDKTCHPNPPQIGEEILVKNATTGQCEKQYYKIGEKMLDKDCNEQLIYGNEIIAVADADSTKQLQGSLYSRIFPNTPVDLQLQLMKLPSRIADIEVGETRILHPSSGISFQVKLEGGKACVYAYDSTGKEWKVGPGFPGSVEDVKEQLTIKERQCQGTNICVDSRCAANGTDAPAAGIGESCLASGSYDIDTQNDQTHCVASPPIRLEKRSLLWSSLISDVCTSFNIPEAYSDFKFTSIIVECIERSMLGLFFPPGNQHSFFEGVQDSLKALIRALLALYVVLLGYRLFMGKQAIPDKKDRMWFFLKFTMVVYFAMGTGMTDLLPKFVTISKSLSILVMEASLGIPHDPALYTLQSQARSDEDTANKLKNIYQEAQNEYIAAQSSKEQNVAKLADLDALIKQIDADIAKTSSILIEGQPAIGPLTDQQMAYLNGIFSVLECEDNECIKKMGCAPLAHNGGAIDYNIAAQICTPLLIGAVAPSLSDQLKYAQDYAKQKETEYIAANTDYNRLVAEAAKDAQEPKLVYRGTSKVGTYQLDYIIPVLCTKVQMRAKKINDSTQWCQGCQLTSSFDAFSGSTVYSMNGTAGSHIKGTVNGVTGSYLYIQCSEVNTTPTYSDLQVMANLKDPTTLDILAARDKLYQASVAAWRTGTIFQGGIPAYTRHGNPPITIPAMGELTSPTPQALLIEKINILKQGQDQLVAAIAEKQAERILIEKQRTALNTVINMTSLSALQEAVNVAKDAYDEADLIAKASAASFSESLATTPHNTSNTGHSYCDYRMFDYPDGFEYLKMWDMVDCKVSRYLGLGVNENASIPQSLWIGMLAVISSSYGVPIFIITLIFIMFVLMVTYRIVHIYIMAFISLLLMVYIAPLIIPSVLFEQTKKIFSRWMRLLISYILQPFILFAFLTYLFAIMDIVFFGGNIKFDSQNNLLSKNVIVVAEASACKGGLISNNSGLDCKDFVTNPTQCKTNSATTLPVYCSNKITAVNECDDKEALACFYQGLEEYVEHASGTDLRVHKIRFKGDDDKNMLFALLKMLLIVFSAYYILQIVEELAMRLTSGFAGGAAALSSAPVLSVGQSMNIIGQAAFRAQQTAVYAPYRAGKGAYLAGKYGGKGLYKTGKYTVKGAKAAGRGVKFAGKLAGGTASALGQGIKNLGGRGGG